MNRRAQSALEYLLTYGWAILIVIIVGASLYALGVFNPGTFTGKRVTGFTQFQMLDHKLGDTNSTLTIFVGNRLGKTVTLTDINATYKNKYCEYGVPGGDQTFGPNTQKNFTWECGGAGDWNTATLDIRTSYSVIVDLVFTDPESGLDHIDSGTLFGAVERQ
jgi:hypothetical protein